MQKDNTKKNIWILSELYYPEQTSTGYLLTKIAEGLAANYAVKVITGPATNFFNSEDCLREEIVNGVEIFRCKGSNLDKNIVTGRLINLVTRSTAILLNSFFKCEKRDYILVVTNPPTLTFVALLVSFVKDCQFITLVHDVYPDVLVTTGLLQSHSPVVKIWNIFNQTIYKNSTAIITLGRDMSKIIRKKLAEGDANKVYCIPNWAETDIVKANNKNHNTLLKELDICQKFVILYAGNMGRTHGVEDLARAAERLREYKDIHFVFLGFGKKKIWLEQYVDGKNIDNVSILPPRPRSEQVIFLNACDLAVVSFIPDMAGISVPSRMYNHMAAGKPIIAVADDWSELAEVIREEEIGWIVKPGDLESLVKTIKFASTHPQLCAEMGRRAANVAQSKYTFARVEQMYKKLFRELFAQENEELSF